MMTAARMLWKKFEVSLLPMTGMNTACMRRDMARETEASLPVREEYH